MGAADAAVGETDRAVHAAVTDAVDDRALVERARAGDVPAFETLYRRHVGRVHGLCLRMTGNRQDAEDCAQAAFINAWEKLSAFEGRSSFNTWLHRIAVNEVLARRRKEARRRRHLDVVDEADETRAADPLTPSTGTRMDLEAAIASLPPGARDVVVLHLVYGFSHEESADMLGLAVGTCKAQLHRARRLLQQRLER